MTAHPRIALALSGGGHRAFVFALGVLLYLADTKQTPSVTSVASVSGGSMANGVIAQDLDLNTASDSDIAKVVRSAARQVTGRGPLFGARITVAYLAALVVLFVAVAVGPWLLPLGVWLKVMVFLVGVLALAWFAALRGRVCARAFASMLYSPAGSPTRLEQLNGGVDHVFCAADLHAGENVYFSREFVCSYRFGYGSPGELPLHRAVQASAAFPGAFPVSWMRRNQFNFNKGQPEAADTRKLALVDGGVYDNMADQWARGLTTRAKRWPQANFKDADQLIVVSASAGLEFGAVGKLRLPILGELLALLRDKAVLYDNGNSLRRQELVANFTLAERLGEGMRGVLVHIPQSPFRVPDTFADEKATAGHRDKTKDEPEEVTARQQRAVAAQELLISGFANEADARKYWDTVATLNAAVPTTLIGLSRDVVARLLYHAYVLAMINLHVILNVSLPDKLPTAQEIADTA